MTLEFIKNTQRFGVRKTMEPICSDEAVVKFTNKHEVQTFFSNAMNHSMNSVVLQQLAKGVAPTFCLRTLKSKPQLTNQERLDYLFSEIAKGNTNVVLKNRALKSEIKTGSQPEADNTEKSFLERTDILKFVERQVNHLKKVFSKIVDADYYILETVYNYDEHSIGVVPVVIDPSSVKEHSTGWTSWDNQFEISALGLFKGMVAFRIGEFLNIGNMAIAAGGFAAGSENITGEYLATGKSIIAREWHGSYAIRYNIRSGYWEIPWIKYKNSGPDQRILVELKRQDRFLIHDRVIYNHRAVLIPPSTTMEKYLQDYAQGTPLPEHDVNAPIKLGRLFTAIS